MSAYKRIKEIEDRLYKIENEKLKLLKELSSIKESHTLYNKKYGQPACNKIPETPAEKIELFKKLFRCREDI